VLPPSEIACFAPVVQVARRRHFLPLTLTLTLTLLALPALRAVSPAPTRRAAADGVWHLLDSRRDAAASRAAERDRGNA